MNTTTNTRGVSEAMVAELIAAGDFLAMNGTDGMVRRWERAKAALSAEPAAQGEAVAWQYRRLDDEEGPSPYWHHMTREQYEMFRDNPRSNCEVRQLFTAPPAQLPEGWRVLQIGAVGSAYDPPNTRRAFTYDWQPGNGGAWALGMASSTAAKTSAGDYIDGGLNLLKALQEQGFGVFQIEPASPAPSEGGKEVRRSPFCGLCGEVFAYDTLGKKHCACTGAAR